MSETDPRDERIRKRFSRLPAIKAPPDFEARLARAIATGRGRGTAPAWWPVRIRTAALSGAALLLVGTISFLVFRGGSDEGAGPALPESDAPSISPSTAPSGPAGGPRGTTTASPSDDRKKDATGLAAPSETPAGKESVPREADKAPPAPTSRAASRPDALREESGAKPATAPSPAGRAKAEKSIRSLLLMERALTDSGAIAKSDTADSAALRDSAAIVDSLRMRDSLRSGPDSLRLESPDPKRR